MILRNFLLAIPAAYLCLLLFTGGTTHTGPRRPPTRTASLQLHFTHVVNGRPMALGTTAYMNAAGESFTITMFKYYISNFTLTTTTGQEITLPAAYFLVNESSDSTKRITLPQAPEGTYQRISFMIGVDSIHNMSGAQTGALDPVNGMFWTWNSGYIMAKLEGNSPVSKQPLNLVEFHIGGFKGASNVLRRVQLNFPQPVKLSAATPATVQLTADAYTWFHLPNAISFKKVASCTTPGTQAAAVADNYRNMFSISN
ncbi:MbnP family protein [Chitinophaga agrisoli]|uniref:MbnP family protein n=1 Tax=Chitinophaga agrisoli TaxID=2607653 RepID=UPI00122E126B|nr:MbnP family protein [Chitinophaga agrisoli]